MEKLARTFVDLSKLKFMKKLMRFMLRSLWATALLLAPFFTPVQASTCRSFLDSSQGGTHVEFYIELPGKRNQFTRKEFDSLPGPHKRLLKWLKSGVEALSHQDVVAATEGLNQNFIINSRTSVPKGFLEFIKTQPQKEKVYLENYYFFRSVLKRQVSEEALIGLSILFSGVKRAGSTPLGFLEALQGESNRLDISKEIARISKTPRFAKALLSLLRGQRVPFEIERQIRSHSDQVAASNAKSLMLTNAQSGARASIDVVSAEFLKAQKREGKRNFVSPQKIEDYYSRRGGFHKNHLRYLGFSVIIVSNLIKKHYRNQFLGGLLGLRFKPFLERLSRVERLAVIEDFLLKNIRSRSSIEDLSILFDRIMFGSEIPLTQDQLQGLVNESLKQTLIPVRTALSSQRVEERRDTAEALPASNLFSFDLNPSGTPAPETLQVLNPNKRQPRQSEGTKEVREVGQAKESLKEIPFDEDLYNYTSLVESPLDFNGLTSEKVYKVRFARAEKPDVQNIEFEPAFLKSLLQIDSRIIEKYFSALNSGLTLRPNQAGLRYLEFYSKRGARKNLYELKVTHIDLRFILERKRNRWVFLTITTKKKFERTLEGMVSTPSVFVGD